MGQATAQQKPFFTRRIKICHLCIGISSGLHLIRRFYKQTAEEYLGAEYFSKETVGSL